MKHQQWRTTPRSNSYKINDDGNIDDVNNDISILATTSSKDECSTGDQTIILGDWIFSLDYVFFCYFLFCYSKLFVSLLSFLSLIELCFLLVFSLVLC